MPDRATMLASLEGRLRAFSDDGDPSHIQPIMAAMEAIDLWNLVDSASDVEAREVIGRFFWTRFLNQREARRIDDLGYAGAAYLPVFRADPHRVPERLRLLYLYVPDGVASGALSVPHEPDWPPIAYALNQSGDLEAMGLALELLRAVSVFDWHSSHVVHLYLLSLVARDLFARQKDKDSALLSEAVTAARSALAFGIDDPSLAAGIHFVLGDVLRERFAVSGQVADLADAVPEYRAALRLSEGQDADRADRLAAAASATRVLSRVTGKVAMLEDSVKLWRESVALTPQADMAYGRRLSELAMVLRLLGLATGRGELMGEVVLLSREAVARLADSDPYRAAVLDTLGVALAYVGSILADEKLLKEAVGILTEALSATPADHPERAVALSNLAAALGYLFRRTFDLEHLATAERLSSEMLDLIPAEHPDRSPFLTIAANVKADRSRETNDLAGLREAARMFKESLEQLPSENAPGAIGIFNLASTLYSIATATRAETDLAAARSQLRLVAEASDATAELRFNATRALAFLDALGGDPGGALALVDQTADLLPYLIPYQLGRDLRERLLRQSANYASFAAATAVSAGRPDRAVELAELFRGVLLGEEMSFRSDLGRLRACNEPFADRFEELRAALDSHAPQIQRMRTISPASNWEHTDGTTPSAADRVQELSQSMEALLRDIRAIPGMAQFMLPAPLDQLRRQAAEGPIVMVYAAEQRGDALIVTDSADQPVHVVPLPGLDEKAALEQVGRLGQHMRAVQEWLWDVIVEPVLETLGTPAPQRLWWCPIGLLSYLPLHAAGRGDQSVLDRVVSSYTPTIRALSYARANRRQSATQVKTLVVGIPHIPNSDPLLGVEVEIKTIKRLIPGSLVLSEKEATREAIMKALPFSNLTHFACHAKSEWFDPSLSRLLLHDDSSGPLTVRDISRLQLSDAQLAFLSACSTAQAGPAFADEVAHITAAFQVAGFQQVIGTLWEVADLVAVRLTELVYEQLTEDGTVAPELDRAAYALHHAVRELRKSYSGEPQYWAGFVHVGV